MGLIAVSGLVRKVSPSWTMAPPKHTQYPLEADEPAVPARAQADMVSEDLLHAPLSSTECIGQLAMARRREGGRGQRWRQEPWLSSR
jgi:hypothetical protein